MFLERGKASMPPNREAGKPLAWLNRAFGDLRIAQRYEPGDYYEDLCFHCQQSVEKAVKAVLIHREIAFIKTHEIKLLLNLLPDDLFKPISDREMAEITEYAVSTRYPGDFEPLAEEDWKRALETAKKILNWAKEIIDKQ